METIFSVASVLVIAIGIYLGIAAYRLRRAAKLEYEQIIWIRGQAERALKQLESDDPDIVIAGLQNLRALTDPAIAIDALQRLEELTHSRNKDVAEQAKVTHKKLLSSLKRTTNRTMGAY